MRNIARLVILSAAGLLAGSAIAQQNPQDFTLPEPTPTGTPAPQGPVDDTGVVPVGPRVIPTATPTPESTGETATEGPPAEPANTQPSPAPTGPAPNPQATFTPPPAPIRTPAIAAPLVEPVDQSLDTQPQTEAADGAGSQLPALPDPEAAQAPETALVNEADTQFLANIPWLYVGGGALVLFILVAALLLWKRRRDSAPPPEIERPLVEGEANPTGASAAPVRFEIGFEVEGVTRSLMAVMVAGRIVVKNRGERAIRGVSLSAELTSAHHPSARTAGNLKEVASEVRVGPHQTHREKVNFRLPLAEVQGINRDGAPFFVPLIRIAALAENAEPQRLDFVLGAVPPGGNQKLQPLPLSGPPGPYEHLRGHPLTA